MLSDFIGSRFQEQERENVVPLCLRPTQPRSFPAAASALHVLPTTRSSAGGSSQGGDAGENDLRLLERGNGQGDL